MKKIIYIAAGFLVASAMVNAQSNFLDNYIGATVTSTVVASSADFINQPRDLDFKPNSNELWICNYGNSSGGSNVIIYNAGMANQTSQYRKDTHTSHFMRYPSALAFGDDYKWAAVSEIQSTAGPTSTFMGPALWSGDTSITAKVFQNNWVSGLPLGSHLDMLHQSPFAMGIAHDSAMAYWVMDGHNGNLIKYDFVQHHGPGYDNHSAGKLWRYIDVTVTRVVNIPSHLVLDKASGWLYFIDGGPKKIKRMYTNSGTITGTLSPPSTANEPLAGYWKVEGATVEEIATLTTQPCGIDYYNGRVVVSDYTNGDIYIYNTTTTPITLLGTINTGLAGMMGVKVGPDGRIWCVNHTNNNLYRLDISPSVTDAALHSITSPQVENFPTDFYSTLFDVCDGNITPSVEIVNTGTTTVTSVDLQYTIDGGTAVTSSVTVSLAPGASQIVSLSSSSVTNGSHFLKVDITSVNGSADAVDLNNTIAGSFRAFTPALSLPVTEGFSATAFPPAGWNYVHFNPNNKMTRVTAGGFGQSVGSMKMDNYSGNTDITGQIDYLLSPLLDLTTAPSNSYLRFNVAHAKYNSASNDRLQVLLSTDCGATWSIIYDKAGTTLSTAPNITTAFTPTAAQWRKDSVSLSAWSSFNEAIFSFTTTSTFGNNVYVDDIFIGDVTAGISETAFTSVELFPNPVSEMLRISFGEKLRHDVQANIYSADGRKAKSFLLPASGKSFSLDVSELMAGIYAVELNDGQHVYSRKLIRE